MDTQLMHWRRDGDPRVCRFCDRQAYVTGHAATCPHVVACHEAYRRRMAYLYTWGEDDGPLRQL